MLLGYAEHYWYIFNVFLAVKLDPRGELIRYIDGILLAIWFYEISLCGKKRRKKMPVTFWECPWQISECRKMPVTSARDIFARDISKTPVTIFKKMPVTSKKWPWQISKIECHAHKKMSRGKKNTEKRGWGTRGWSTLAPRVLQIALKRALHLVAFTTISKKS